MSKKITLRNDFHKTEVNLIPCNGRLSASQVRRARRALCGMADCRCGDIHGPQEVELEPCSDGSMAIVAEPKNGDRMRILNSEIFDPNTATSLYLDKDFSSSRGTNYYLISSGEIIEERWSNWRWEYDSYRVISKEEFADEMRIRSSEHPEQAMRALEMIGVKVSVL